MIGNCWKFSNRNHSRTNYPAGKSNFKALKKIDWRVKLLDVKDLVSNFIKYRFSLKTSPPLTEKQNLKISQNYGKIRICLQEFREDTHRQRFLPTKFNAHTEASGEYNISVKGRPLSLIKTISFLRIDLIWTSIV